MENNKKAVDEFLPRVKKIDVCDNLRDKDRYLFGKSVYEGLIKFLK